MNRDAAQLRRILSFYSRTTKRSVVLFGINSPLVQVAVTGASVTLATVARIWLNRIDVTSPFIFYFLAVMISSMIGGFRSGLLATVFSILLVDYYFLPPFGHWSIPNTANLIIMLVFSTQGIGISIVAEAMHRAFRLLQEQTQNLKKTGKELLLLNKTNASILASITDAFFTVNRRWLLTYINPQAEKVLQVRRKEVLGKTLWSVFPALRKSPVGIVCQKAMKLQKPTRTEQYLGDNHAWFDVHVYPFSGGLFVYYIDITQRRQVEEMRGELAAIVASSDDAILSRTLDGRITSWNKGAERLYGFKASEALGQDISIIIPEGRRDEIIQLETLKKRGPIIRFETERLRKNGTKIYVSATVSPVKDARGRIIGVSAIGRDITRQKKTQERITSLLTEIQLQRQRLDTVISNVPGVVLEAWGKPDAASQRIDFVSEYVETMLGYSTKEWLATPNFWLRIVHPEDKERAAKEASAIFESKKGGTSRFRWLRKDGSTIWVEAQSTVILDSRGKPIGTRGVTMDITERMELERRKDEFISMASHELKTPVTSLKVYTQLLIKSAERQKNTLAINHLFRMNAQIDRLTNLISDLLDLSRIQSGKLEFTMEKFNLHALITETIDSMQAMSKFHTFMYENKDDIVIIGDRDRIGQVMINLLTNAVKYSPQAKQIIITARKTENEAIVSVQDFGIGIEKAHQQHIFERFYQAGSSRAQTFPGLGIGLYICAQIIARHKGTISVKSEKQKGSTFTFTLPLMSV